MAKTVQQTDILVHAFNRAQEIREFIDYFEVISGAELILVVGPKRDFERFASATAPGVTFLFQDFFWKSRALQTAFERSEPKSWS